MKNRYTVSLFIFLGFLFILSPGFSQTTNQAESPANPAEKAELPRSYRGLALGMSLDELKTELMKDSLFLFRGDRDVSFLPIQEQTLIETTGISFIRRAFFQLEGGKLFIMSFTLDPNLIDHYSVFTTFVSKYGEPTSLNPRQAVWVNSNTRISIERPLTVKYIDKVVFDQLIEESSAQEALELELRRNFLNEF